MTSWTEGRNAGKPFTIKPAIETHLLTNTAVLSRAELEQPCCEVCYRPGRRPFCQRCEGTPAAAARRAL